MIPNILHLAHIARSKALAFLAITYGVAIVACCSAPRRPDGGEGTLGPGMEAPDLEAFDANGAPTRLSSLRGHPAIVYFYPKDGTPGCTTEACAFRDAWKRFQWEHVAVIGVSSQSRQSH